MKLHGNARLSPFQRELLCRRVEDEGWTAREAAEAAGCSERTAYTWLAHRARALRPWLRYYNERRPHGALGHKTPHSRLAAEERS